MDRVVIRVGNHATERVAPEQDELHLMGPYPPREGIQLRRRDLRRSDRGVVALAPGGRGGASRGNRGGVTGPSRRPRRGERGREHWTTHMGRTEREAFLPTGDAGSLARFILCQAFMRVEAKMGSDVVLRIPCPEFEGVSSNERVHVGFESKIFKVRTARDADVRVVIEERQEPVRTAPRDLVNEKQALRERFRVDERRQRGPDPRPRGVGQQRGGLGEVLGGVSRRGVLVPREDGSPRDQRDEAGGRAHAPHLNTWPAARRGRAASRRRID
mmetsp:Transcript_15202/g.45492  ORF Transcript_15202/g.45492 Transcript_15202/m.45492 type:complete len:272 (+) Transcript_15202:423-1238(+)